VAQIRTERQELHDLLVRLDGQPRVSQGNFVFAELGPRSVRVHAALRSQGIVVRSIVDSAGVPLGLRIALPGDPAGFDVLVGALEVALSATGEAT
jgi:histidinol-phosphate/aromatic aminotransferase/cobyric acid decarboxylase-like protein